MPDSDSNKRKRDAEDASAQPGRAHHVSTNTPSQSGAPGFINYLPRSNTPHLSLMQGDADTFASIISLIGEYESVLDRHESLAASLGAKLTGPRLLKGIEKFFDGPIKATPLQPFPPYSDAVSWIDVVNFARAHPKEFVLTQMPDGSRCCQFVLKGSQVEITEDDWRLIWSGALERFPLDHPFEEDEMAELATLDILEQRTSVLYKKADEVAARARILHHKLGHRKQDIRRRRNTQESPSSRYQAAGHNPVQRSSGLGTSYDLHTDLLQQFIAASASPSQSRSTSVVGASALNVGQPSPGSTSSHHQTPFGTSSRVYNTTEATSQSVTDARSERFRILITQSIDKLEKGGVINPPCDRCRRLNTPCQKHLTACVGCTKKHAKCSWKTVTDDEITHLKQETLDNRINGAEEDRNNKDGGVELPTLRDSSQIWNGPGEKQDCGRTSGDGTPGTMITDDGSPPPSRGNATMQDLSLGSAKRVDITSELYRSNASSGRDESDQGSRGSDQAGSRQVPSITSITSKVGQPRMNPKPFTDTPPR